MTRDSAQCLAAQSGGMVSHPGSLSLWWLEAEALGTILSRVGQDRALPHLSDYVWSAVTFRQMILKLLVVCW